MLRFHSVLAASLLLFVSYAHGQQPQWKLAKNDQFAARNVQTTEVATTGGFESKQHSLYDISTTWKVVAIETNKTAKVQITIESIKVKINNSIAPTMAVDVDTQGKEPSAELSKTFLKHMKTLIGKTFQMNVTPSGKITHLPLPAETKKTIDAFPKTDYVLQTFHIESVVQSMTGYFPAFPANLAKGKSWRTSSDPKTATNEAFVSTTTYAGPKQVDGKEVMQFVLETSPKKTGDRKLNKEGREPFVVSKQTGKGSSLFDAKLGNFTSAIYQNEIESTTEYEGTKSGTRIVTDHKISVTRK